MKKIISIILSVAMLLSFTAGLNLTVYADELTTGQCGENVYYEFSEQTGELTISGSGDMFNYSDYSDESLSPFYNKDIILSVHIENGVTSIGSYSFSALQNLKEVIIPDSVLLIERYAFANCYSLEKISLGNCIKGIRYSAFENCSNLKEITLPDTLTYLGASNYVEGELYGAVFRGCNNLETVKLSSNLLYIADWTFCDCEELKYITLPNKITEVGKCAFKNCNSLEAINIPENVKCIGRYAFSNCSNLNTITFYNPECSIYNEYETISGKAKIIGYIDSTAQTYAANYNRTFIDINTISDDVEHTHSYTSSITKQPTCTSTGVKTFTCSCGDSYTVDIPKSEHIYSTKTIKATTSNNGSITTSCDVCGDIKSSQVIYCPKSYTLSASNYTYDGKVKKPAVTVKDSKGNNISAKNYTVTYTNNKNVGKATVKITFKGNYSGTVSKNFTINPKPTKITSLKTKSKGFKVKWSKVTAQADGYQIQYSASSSFKSAKTVTVKGNKKHSKNRFKAQGKEKILCSCSCL